MISNREGTWPYNIVCLLFLDSKHSIGSLILKDAIKFCECANNTMDLTFVMRVTKTYNDTHLVKNKKKRNQLIHSNFTWIKQMNLASILF